MKGMDLLNALGRVQDSFVTSAGDFRENQGQPRRLALRRAWLIAAIIAVLLMLVGCAVVYVLRLQDMKVGEYSFYIPTEYYDDGSVIPVETQEPLTLLSLQGTNMEALSEWVAFTKTYDQDGSIMLEADIAAKSGSPWDIPENYRYTYDCYSQEMVDKLNEIVEKYNLKLLSRKIFLDSYENSVLFQSLGLDGLIYDSPDIQVEYSSGAFYVEGTFSLNIYISMDMGSWKWEQGFVSYRYSLKDYFDPATGSMLESIPEKTEKKCSWY